MAADPRFHTTRWSMIFLARASGEPGSAKALAELCETYWYPLYSFARRRGYGPDDALDLTQGYFVQLLETRVLEDARPDLGRFRSYLLSSFKFHEANQRRERATIKRGGGRTFVELDADEAERRYREEPVAPGTPEQAYEYQWALTVMGQARDRLRRELEEAGKGEHYRLLSGYLSGEGETPYREVAETLDTTEAGVKMAVTRLRRRFGRLLREEIARTVADDDEVDREVRHLLAVLRG